MDTSPQPRNDSVPAKTEVTGSDDLFECAFDPMLVIRGDGRILRVNQAAASFLGFGGNELLEMNIQVFMSRDAFDALVPNAPNERLRVGEFAISTRNGNILPVQARMTKTVDGSATSLGMTFRKIAKSVSPPESLFDSVTKTAAAMNHVPVPILLTRWPDHKIVAANTAFLSTFGYKLENILGRPSVELGLADSESQARILEEIGHRGYVRDMLTTRVGRGEPPRLLSMSAERLMLGDEAHILTVAVECTTPISAQQIDHASDERLSNFVRQAPLSMALFDRNMHFVVHSRRFLEEFRIPQEDVTGWCLYDVFPDLPEEIRAVHRRCLAGASESSEETPLPFNDGTMEWYRWEMTPWRNRHGEICGVTFFSQRITELKTAQQRIAEQERLLADVTDGSPSLIIAFDRSARVMFANEAAAITLGTTKEELVGALATTYLPPLQGQKFMQRHLRVMETGKPEIVETSLLVVNVRVPVLAARYPLRDTSGSIYGTASIMTDISRLKEVEAELRRSEGQKRDALTALEKALEITRKTEEKLIHAQKMEAVGRLAGGIAHDFNNLLTVILGNSGEVLAGLRAEDPMHEIISEIEKAGQRAAGLTRQLLAFSRKQVLEPRIVNVNELIVSAERMLRRIVGEDIELTLLLDPRPQFCKLDKGQFEQVLMNLVVNARDAMHDGGRLTIETASVMLDAGYVEDHPDVAPGEHVRITVSDTGVGISRDIQAHIFEPFFTTKSDAGGTGLGLSTAYGIVRQSGGTIWLYSEPGQGTTFKIFFPRQTGGLGESAPLASTISTKRGKETILIVEDEEQVRATIAGILRRAGYHVISAVNGGEALLICEQHGSTIHLLLTDVVMPKLNGRKLAERLLQIRPNMRVLFMSGYTENVVVHHGILDGNFNFLPKPVTADALLTKVREVLEYVR